MKHDQVMKIVFDLALKGLGHTSPHPLVGAVLVKEGRVIGRGYYKKYGGATAESNAIADAKLHQENPEGAILYSNVDGKLNASDLVREREINEVFYKFRDHKLPFVHLNRDSSEEFVNELRQRYDCVIVERVYIERENPSLITNSDKFNDLSHPLRLIMGPLAGLNPQWKILDDELRRNTMFIATHDEVSKHQDVAHFLEKNGTALLSVKPNAEGSVDLLSLLKSLASLKLTSLLIEGDSDLSQAFLKQGLVDKIS
jgi:diaminohydroxyphosphoribosylaminopyrimidine deaminase/5-amino-6-(5-phosphoribosylamino)uracil reductase